ncbi:MAG: LamG-like jellyroll fold domain-containing protein, partial [Patescibacteria group bacterium]|nr:LamG-like jellyroll fold domain-containing protein [Patescibacteria group bacterium]
MKYRTLIVQGCMLPGCMLPGCLVLGCLVLGCLVLGVRGSQAAPVYSNHLIFNTDPVLYWRLDEVLGTVAYDAAPGTPDNGTYQSTYSHGVAGPRPADGFPTMNPGNVAVGAATGNARVRYTSLSDTAGVGTGSYSYQVWFNSSVTNWTDRTLQYLFTRGNDDTDAGRRDAVYIGGNWAGAPTGKLSLITSTAAGVVGTRTLDPNRWYHLVVTRDDYEDPANPGTTLGDIRVYLNGKLEMQSTAPWQGGTGNHLTAGNRTDWHSTLGLHGAFDEAAVWNRPLSEAEARNLYYDALGSPYLASVLRKDPVAYWRLEETTGTARAYDFTGNGRSFTYQAAATRTGTGTDVGPGPAEFGGMPADNRAPTLTGGPLIDASNGYLGVVTGLLPGAPGGTNNDYSVEMWVRRGDDPNAHGDYLMHRWDPGSTAPRG